MRVSDVMERIACDEFLSEPLFSDVESVTEPVSNSQSVTEPITEPVSISQSVTEPVSVSVVVAGMRIGSDVLVGGKRS